MLPVGCVVSGVGVIGGALCCLGLVDRTFWRCWAMCPVIVLSKSGQYHAALEYVKPLSKVKLPALIASSQVCLTGKLRHV